MDELVFVYGFSAFELERAPISKIYYWHGRAVKFAKRQAEQNDNQTF